MIFGLFGGEKKRVAELIAAARTGDTEKIKQLLAKGTDINGSEPESGDTPLIAAIDKNQWITAELLLSHKPSLTAEDKNGNSALYLAACKGDQALQILTQLLDTGAPVDLGPSHGGSAGATPLFVASATGANGCVDSLLSHGASTSKVLPSGETPLHSAAIGGDRQTVDLLIKAGVNIKALDKSKKSPLHNCGFSGNNNAAQELVRQGAVIDGKDVEGCSPLMRAVMNNHAEVVKLLLDNQADPDIVVHTDGAPLYPLLVAAINGYDEVLRLLIDAGADVTAKFKGAPSPVDAAKHNGHESTAKLLAAAIKKKKAASTAAKEVDGLWGRIVQAIAQKDQDGLRTLVNGKAFESLAVDARLIAACALGDAKVVRTALQAGADPNKPCNEGFTNATPLVMTVGVSRSVEVASLLIDAGADVNDEWSENTTPIFETTADQFYDLAKLLINRGANVNVQLSNGQTPLMFAARNGASRCVDLFLEAGADINAVEKEQGVGAFGLALNRLDLPLAEQLLARGAEPNFGSIETLPLAIAEHGSLAFIHALEARGCKLVRDDQRGRMAFVSARNPDPEVFDYLLNHGADPSEGNEFGYTPLILAALNNHHHLIRRYLVRGDDASVRDVDGETALSLAIEKRHEDSVAVLREFHVEEGDYSALEDEAAMLKAAADGALGSILNLRESGVPVNCFDEDGNSPLTLAARAGHHGVVRSLYHLGADINHRNHAGDTALSLAKTQDASDIVNTLQEFGALDGATGEFAKFSAMFGGIPIYNAADTMFVRMSHPYKQKPPYDNEAGEDEEDPQGSEDEQDELGTDESEERWSDDSDFSTSVESKLMLLHDALNSDSVKEQLPESVLQQLQEKLDHWFALQEETDGVSGDELVELNRLLGALGLGQEEKTQEVERTPLFEAVHAQDLAAVRKIIKGGGDVNEVDGEGNTPLLIAVLTRQAKLVEELLKLGADPNKARPDGKGPLFAAVRVSDEKLVQVLLKGGAEVDAPLNMEHNGTPVDGCTALYIAAFLGHLPSCKVLLSGGASLEAANELGYAPLMAAIQSDHEEVIDYLLKSGANVNPDVVVRPEYEGLGGLSPINTAAQKGNISVVKKLLKRGVDINRQSENGWTSLKSAAQLGNLDLVKVLLEGGADPNIADDTNYTPLMNAVSGEHEDIVKILLKFKADPNVQSGENPEAEDWEAGRTALMDAALSGNVSIANVLLKNGANPHLITMNGRSALHSAVFSANPEMVTLILKSGADVNARVNGNGKERVSPLDMALGRWAELKETEREEDARNVLKLMMQKGKPDDCDSLNEVALSLLTEGHFDVIELLQSYGFFVDPNFSSSGVSQLFITAAIGDEGFEAAEKLLQLGADANFKTPAGMSVLSMATRNGAVRIAEVLLKAGAMVMDRNSANALAYDLAVIYGHDELVDLLIKHMNQIVPHVDRQAEDGTTALMRAAIASDVKMVYDLLAVGADASRRDRQGESPLSYAVAHDMDEVVHALRATGVEKLPGEKVVGPESIVHAGRQGALGTILDLLDSGVPIDLVDAKGDTALTAAAIHPGVIKVLAKKGADMSHRNGEGKTAYMVASAANRVRMVETLQEVGAPVDEIVELDGMAQVQAILQGIRANASDSDVEESDGGSKVVLDSDQLMLATLTGDALTVSHQIAAGIDVNIEDDEGRTPLMMAVAGLARGGWSRRRERDFEQIIDSLLATGADPDRGAMSTLVLATMSRRVHLVNAMLRAGANVDAVDELPTIEEGETMRATALFVALAPNEHGTAMDERISLTLLEAGPDLSFSSDDGSMAVHYAAKSGMAKALDKILEKAPETIDVADKDGATPLMLASAEGQVGAINLLLMRGANRNIRNAKGQTAVQIAEEAGHTQAVSTLT